MADFQNSTVEFKYIIEYHTDIYYILFVETEDFSQAVNSMTLILSPVS